MESLKKQIEIASAQPTLPPEKAQPQQPEALKPSPSRVNPPLPAELPKPSEVTPELQAKERVKMELNPDGDSLPQDDEPKRKRGLTRLLKSSLLVDRAVLTTSLLVPPSIPLTLAQSRLGRRLTGRMLKKTKTHKAVAAKVVRDVGDMPITQRRRR